MIVGNNWQLADVPGLVQEKVVDMTLTMVVRRDHPLAGRTDLPGERRLSTARRPWNYLSGTCIGAVASSSRIVCGRDAGHRLHLDHCARDHRRGTRERGSGPAAAGRAGQARERGFPDPPSRPDPLSRGPGSGGGSGACCMTFAGVPTRCRTVITAFNTRNASTSHWNALDTHSGRLVLARNHGSGRHLERPGEERNGHCSNPRTFSRLKVSPITARIGAEIGSRSPREDLPDDTIAEIRSALLTYKVVFFRDQDITRGPAHRLCPAFRRSGSASDDGPGSALSEIFTSRRANGQTSGADMWHSDVTWRALPSMGSVLRRSHAARRRGYDGWSDMVAAYEGLSPALKDWVCTLTAIHDGSGFAAFLGIPVEQWHE